MIDPVWQLYARAIERCGPTPTLLEWDDHIPSFDEVHAEAKKAERYLHADLQSASALPGIQLSNEVILSESAVADESKDLRSPAHPVGASK